MRYFIRARKYRGRVQKTIDQSMKDKIKLTENLFEEFPEVTASEWKAEIV